MSAINLVGSSVGRSIVIFDPLTRKYRAKSLLNQSIENSQIPRMVDFWRAVNC